MPYDAEKAQSNEEPQKTSLVSRNITVSKKRTSIRLEPEMWASLGEIAKREQCSIHDICTLVSVRKKRKSSLTAAIRVFIMLYFCVATTEDGHRKAGHGNFEFMKRRAGVQSGVVSAFVKREDLYSDCAYNSYR